MIFLKHLIFCIAFINVTFLSYTDGGLLYIIQYLTFFRVPCSFQDSSVGLGISYVLLITIYLVLHLYRKYNNVVLNIKLFLASVTYIGLILYIKNTQNYLIFLNILNLTFVFLFIYFFKHWKMIFLFKLTRSTFIKSFLLLVGSAVIYISLLKYYGVMNIPPFQDNFVSLLNDKIEYRQFLIMFVFSFYTYSFANMIFDGVIYIFQQIKKQNAR